MEFDDLNKEIEKDRQEVYEKNCKIVSCLSDYQVIAIKGLKFPLSISIKDKYVAYNLIALNIEYVENALPNKQSYESICLKIFKVMFLGPQRLNYDDLDKKIDAFKMILKKLKNGLKPKEETDYIKYVIESKQKKDWKKLLNLPLLYNGGLSLLIAIILNFSTSKIEIFNILIDMLKMNHTSDFKIKFDINNLNDIEEKNFASSFVELFKNNTEYFYLDYEDGKIFKKLLSPELTCIAMEMEEKKESSINNQEDDKKGKKSENNSIPVEKKGVIKKDKNNNKIQSEIKEEPKESKDNKDIQYDKKEIAELSTNLQSQSLDNKKDSIESDVDKNNEIFNQLNMMKNELKGQNQKIKNLQDENEGQEQKIKNLQDENKGQEQKIKNLQDENKGQNQIIDNLHKEISNYKNKIIKQEKEIEGQKNKFTKKEKELEKEITVQKNKFDKYVKESIIKDENMQQKLYIMNRDLEKIKFDLNLIKSRGAIKTFVEFFYRGYELKDAKSYEDKANKISFRLNEYFNSKDNDLNLVNQLKILLREASGKLKIGNFEAHNIDKSKPIIPQLFKIIEPYDNYDKLCKKLEKVKADKIILESINNKEKYYLEREKNVLIENENNTFAKITSEMLNSIFIMDSEK